MERVGTGLVGGGLLHIFLLMSFPCESVSYLKKILI